MRVEVVPPASHQCTAGDTIRRPRGVPGEGIVVLSPVSGCLIEITEPVTVTPGRGALEVPSAVHRLTSGVVAGVGRETPRTWKSPAGREMGRVLSYTTKLPIT